MSISYLSRSTVVIANNSGNRSGIVENKEKQVDECAIIFLSPCFFGSFFLALRGRVGEGKTSFLPSKEEHRRECEGEKRWRRGGKKKRRKEEK